MKKIYIVGLLLVFGQIVGQKKYYFDYAFSVKESYNLNSETFNSVFLVNSKNNKYHLYAHENKDSLLFALHFIDFDGTAFNGTMTKSDFYKVETITNTCSGVLPFRNQYKNKYKEYDFVNFKDTIMDNVSYFHYAIESNKKINYQKRKKIVSTHFIIDKTSFSFLPFTYTSTMYGAWGKSKKIPTGFPKIVYFINSEGLETGRMEITPTKVDKYTTIPDDCVYLK